MTDHILPRVKMELGGGGGHVPEVSLCLEWPNGMPHFRCELTAGLHDNYTRNKDVVPPSSPLLSCLNNQPVI